MTSIMVLGEFDRNNETHLATNAAIAHSAARLGADVAARWVGTDECSHAALREHDGLLVAPGSPYRNFEGALEAIRYAREHDVPCLGTCGGFQHMLIEYARNGLEIAGAGHAEYDPHAAEPFISALYCSLFGRELTVLLTEGSRAARIYGATRALERYYCSFGVNPAYRARLEGGAFKISGSDEDGEVRIMELDGHRFFIGTLFVPQARSREGRPHPLVSAFVQASLQPG